MKIIHTFEELNEITSKAKSSGRKIGFVPTMGALHNGHLSLVHLAREHADITIVSIFVNPTQFAPHEDFDQYPREESKDAEKLKGAGADFLFLPTTQTLYPDGLDSAVQTGKNAQGLESIFRPTHFTGVLNVVYRLFNAVKPDVAIFGEKDYQQLQVIREMVKAYTMPIEIIGADIARDEHGLALSSRNAYLSDKQRNIARQLNVIIKEAIESNDLHAAQDKILNAGFDKIDYIEKRWGRILVAVWLGKTRLIDNMPC